LPGIRGEHIGRSNILRRENKGDILMTKKEFQVAHNLTDEKMAQLDFAIKLVKGKIVDIEDKHAPSRAPTGNKCLNK